MNIWKISGNCPVVLAVPPKPFLAGGFWFSGFGASALLGLRSLRIVTLVFSGCRSSPGHAESSGGALVAWSAFPFSSFLPFPCPCFSFELAGRRKTKFNRRAVHDGNRYAISGGGRSCCATRRGRESPTEGSNDVCHVGQGSGRAEALMHRENRKLEQTFWEFIQDFPLLGRSAPSVVHFGRLQAVLCIRTKDGVSVVKTAERRNG